ncbi:protein sidekick-2-like isoform X2 [Haliotis rubra]|uniref:protein sidekick-2-like isoform X2 n=1 Tax=Haliotis rubra TaxID=36100 RepID=UPI001EE62A3D|nr:protein sidekick-2-like isoform X2 [Haliotis rubra]
MNLQSALLRLLLLPVVSSQIEWLHRPQSQAVIEGHDVRLDCQVKDLAGRILVYEWRFNGSQIQTKAAIFGNNSLLIPQYSSSDVGLYDCVISSSRNVSPVSKTATVILAYINKFQLSPASVRVEVNTSVTFECITGSSAPYPRVYWDLNGKEFLGGEQITASYGDYDATGLSAQYSMKLILTIDRTNIGILRCMALNTLLKRNISSVDAAIFLKDVATLPVLLAPPAAEVVAPVNTSLVLDCLVQGKDVLVLWFRNDASINGSSTSYIFYNGSLIFTRVLLEDAGIYYCQGVNAVGTVTSAPSNVTVTVLNVDFQAEPSDATIFAGQSLTLKCVPPISIPPARVTWYRDYQPLQSISPSAGVWDLQLQSVQADDEGDYFCVAENSLSVPTSRTSRVATVTVQGAPIFTEPPLNQRVIKGRLLQLTCQVQGSPTPTVSWLFHGRKLSPSSQISFRASNQELFISNVDKSHEGRYTCITHNVYGTKSVNVSVIVIVPPVTLKDFGTIVVTSGDTAILPCDVYGDPRPDAHWFTDGKQIEEDGRRSTVNLSLYIENVTAADQGHYACRADNEAGGTWANGTLSVQVPPKITKGPVDKVVVIGQSVLQACNTQGVPSPTIQWRFNSTKYLPEGVSLLSDRITLKIPRVDWLHVGTYTCVATNIVGLDSKSGTIKLKVPPSIKNVTGNNIVDKGETILLDCLNGGTPTPQVEWTHKGEVIQETLDGRVTFPSRQRLRIMFSTVQDAGLYGCRVSNDVGNATRTLQVYVIEPPKPPVLSNAVALSKSSVELLWIPNSQEPLTNVTGYAVNYKKRPETQYVTFPGRLPPTLLHYEVENLLPGTKYTFTISAQNSAGLGVPSNALTVTTLEAGPSAPLRLRLLSTSARGARLSWEVPAQQNGNIRKYQVQYREMLETDTGITEYDVQEILDPNLPNQEFDLLDLHPYTKYEIRVRAANREGEQDLWGPFSSSLTLRTHPAPPDSGPRHVTAVAVGSRIVEVTWQPPPAGDENGPITRYTLRYRQLLYHTLYLEKHILNSTSVNLTELSPWTNYFLVMEAENSAGRSPVSDPVSVQTLPETPTHSPVNLQVISKTSNQVGITWEVPPVREWSAPLSGCVVQYKAAASTTWRNITITNISITTVNISEMTPWTGYSIRAAVYAVLVTPGLGPFSAPVEVKTLPDVPGPVEQLEYATTNSSISIWWLPPQTLNGKLQHYTVTYVAMVNTPVETPRDTVQVLPGLPVGQQGQGQSYQTDQQNTTISDLTPATVYNVSVRASTDAGEGPVQYVVISTTYTETLTDDPPLPTTDISTDATVNTTTNLLTDPGGNSRRNLPVIVAGALTGGIFLLVLLAIIIWRCLKKRKAGRDQYMKSMVSGVRITKRESGNFDRQILDPAHTGDDDMATQTDDDSNVHETQQRYGSFNSHDPIPQSPNSIDSVDINGDPPPPSTGSDKKSGSFFRSLRNSISGDSVFAISSGSGFENPSYFDERMSATLPRHGIPSMTADQVYSETERSQRKNRMRSESAAAIAIMRSSGNLAIASDDTDSLIHNEAIVVYNERTAL